MKQKILTLLAGAATLGSLPATSNAQVLYSEDFDVNHTANWNVNTGGGASVNTANIFFDYSTVGIPSAPHSVGGSTFGAKLNANNVVATAALGGVSISPIGQSFTGDYQLRFDMWSNFIGPGSAGGSGSTQITGGGIGTSGTAANYAGVANGIWFAATGDGNSSVDYRAYTPAAPAGLTTASPGIFAAGNQNQSAALYTGLFPAHAAPAAQTALFPSQTGNTLAGALGWAWRDVVINKSGNMVTWTIDGTLIASLDASTNGVLSGANILLVQSDINTTASADANGTALNFGLFDNVTVTVPEPATGSLLVLGATAVYLARKRRA